MNATVRTSFVAALSVAAALLVPTTQAVAATVDLLYRFDNGGTTFDNPGLVSTGTLTPTGASNMWSVSVGSLNPAGLNVNGTGAAGKAIAASATAGNWQTGNGFNFSLSIAAGSVFNIDSISFYEQGSTGTNGVGPNAWSLSIASPGVGTIGAGGITNPGSNAVHNSASPLAADVWSLASKAQGLTGTLNFTIAASGAANNTTASWRVDNFRIVGNVVPAPVPLPAAVWLMGSALVGVLGLRRRQA